MPMIAKAGGFLWTWRGNSRQIMGRPTAHGIGWRVDFRLRPNPSVTAVAMRVDNAMSYYEIPGAHLGKGGVHSGAGYCG